MDVLSTILRYCGKKILIKMASLKISKAFKQHTLKHFYPKFVFHTASFFSCFATFLSGNSLNEGAPMISPKVIMECPDLSAKKHFKKDNP